MAFRRLALALVAATALGSALIHAQIPGRNVNMVSGTALFDGDPFLQRQNEPSVAASTRNPLHLLAGANDYRAVDLPGIDGSFETGDAWVGVFKSNDGGQRWTSTLLPGYPQDTTVIGHASPLWRNPAVPGSGYGAASDPVIRAGTNGLFYYAGLAFDRGSTGKSAVFVARFIDNNNREKGEAVAYLGAKIVAADTGVTGRLLDKPWLAVDIPRGGGTCPVATDVLKPPASQGGPPIVVREIHNLPAGPIYIAYSAFTGSGATLKSDILFSYSTDCGVTFSAPQRLNDNDGSLNQGASIAVDPTSGNVYVSWRRFTRLGSPSTDAIMVARSVNLGKRFINAQAVRKLPRGRQLGRLMQEILEHRRSKDAVEVEDLSEFDQGTSALDISFRTNAYSTMTFDDRGRLYIAWTERGFSTLRPDPNDGDTKIVMSTSNNGVTWTSPSPVSEANQPGHQIMPSLAFSGGKLLLIYYDLREDVTELQTPYIDDKTAAAVTGKRHTLDIRASMGKPGAVPVFASSVRVSDYFIGHRQGGTTPDSKLVTCPAGGGESCEQLQFNPPNLPMFAQGTVPFFGDYIDISPAPVFVPAGKGGWTYNTSSNAPPLFHAVWTDNRDVRPPAPGTSWSDYTPPFIPGVTSDKSVYDPSKPATACLPNNTGMRNQNIYTARITGGLLVGSPGNTKPLSPSLQRGFVVFAQNMTTASKAFRMRITNQPIGGSASFQQIAPVPVTSLDVATPPRSTASRTVYVTSSDPHARINVEVFEIDRVGAPQPTSNGLQGTIILNADIENADIENADIENADIENADIENTEVTSADIENPSVRVADIENADIENADIENADIENADIENADIENADIENADIENGSPFDGAPTTDVTWSVTNTGNTTTAFSVNLFLSQNAPTSGVKTQLILHKSYLTPAAVNCDLKVRSNTVLVANIINPVFVTPSSGGLPDPNDPSATNASMLLGPNETGKFTLRIRDIDPSNNVTIINDKGEPVSIDSAFVPGTAVAPIVTAQEISTADLEEGVTKPPVTTTDGSTMFFVTQPVASAAGVIMNPVRVQVRDKSGAVLPNVDVTLSLGSNPTGAVLAGFLTKATDATGIAVFDNLAISIPGDNYRLRAVASQGGTALPIAPADSAFFNVRIMVLNTSDAGSGSLREAILLANANTGVRDVISFAIPGAGAHTITLESPLPGIDDGAVIDATPAGVCTGAAPLVEIDGVNTFQHGLFLGAPGTTIRGLAITRFAASESAGIYVSSSGFGSTVECSYLGLAPDGTTARGNYYGIRIGYANNTVGGTTTATRNVISGNLNTGILVQGPTPDSEGGFGIQNTVRGNYIGTDATGSLDRGNGGNGILITNAQLNTIAGNVVSGNAGEGIRIDGFRSRNNTLQGNFIGTNAAGTADLGNDASGIYIRRSGANSLLANLVSGNDGFAGIAICGTPSFCGGGDDVGATSSEAAANVITGNIIGLNITIAAPLGNAGYGISLDGAPSTKVGGELAGDANVVAANRGLAGIVIFGTESDATVLRGNYIGTNVAGASGLGNAGPGVAIENGSDNTVGGNDATGAAPNVIMFNNGPGVHVSAGTRNKIRRNRIDLNAALGIDLGLAGVTANDPGDGDTGPNDLQNAPVLSSAQIDGETVVVHGTLNSTAQTQFTVDLYVGPACDASGTGQGRQWFGAMPVSTNSDGNATFDIGVDGSVVAPGQVVTALTTTGNLVAGTGTGSTSEFSNCVTATGPAVVSAVTDPSGDADGPDLVSNTVVNTGDALVFQVRFAPGTFNPENTVAQLLLDTDRNPATGHPGVTKACNSGSDTTIGSEFIVRTNDATVQRYTGECNTFEFVAKTSIETVTDGYNIRVSLRAIGNAAVLNYKVISYLPDSDVLDVMPNEGQPAAATTAPGGGGN